MAFELLLPHVRGIVAPDDVVSARLELEQTAAVAIALRNEHLVTNDDRVGRVNTLAVAGPPRVMKLLQAAGRMEAEQTAAGKIETQRVSVDRRHDGNRVAGQLLPGAVLLFTGSLIKGDDGAARCSRVAVAEIDRTVLRRAAADRDDQQIAVHKWGAADAEEVLHDAVLHQRVHLPHRFAVRDLQTVQYPLRAVDIDAILVHDGAGPRPAVVAV